jgi:hypothetical protein
MKIVHDHMQRQSSVLMAKLFIFCILYCYQKAKLYISNSMKQYPPCEDNTQLVKKFLT